MKNQGIANSITAYLSSRNNDIGGYWGIGVLCKYCVVQKRQRCGINITKQSWRRLKSLEISGYLINDGLQTLERIVGDRGNKIEQVHISIKFMKSNSNMLGYSDWYDCIIDVLVAGNGRYGFSRKQIQCWPHNSSRESQRLPS